MHPLNMFLYVSNWPRLVAGSSGAATKQLQLQNAPQNAQLLSVVVSQFLLTNDIMLPDADIWPPLMLNTFNIVLFGGVNTSFGNELLTYMKSSFCRSSIGYVQEFQVSPSTEYSSDMAGSALLDTNVMSPVLVLIEYQFQQQCCHQLR